MSKPNYVLKNTPHNLGLGFFGFVSFLMYYFKMDPLYVGIIGTILFVLFCINVAAMFTQTKVDIGPLLEVIHEMNEEKANFKGNILKTGFADRLESAMNKAAQKAKESKT